MNKFARTKKAQVSLEYLLVITGFFSALAMIIPMVNYSSEQFFLANDTLLSKQIIGLISEQDALFQLLGNDSKKEFEFFPAKQIKIRVSGKQIVVSAQKSYYANVLSSQKTQNKIFSSKFKMVIEKQNNVTYFSFLETN